MLSGHGSCRTIEALSKKRLSLQEPGQRVRLLVTTATEAVGPRVREPCAPAAKVASGHLSCSVRPDGAAERMSHTFLGSHEATPTPPQAAAILVPLIPMCNITMSSPLLEILS